MSRKHSANNQITEDGGRSSFGCILATFRNSMTARLRDLKSFGPAHSSPQFNFRSRYRGGGAAVARSSPPRCSPGSPQSLSLAVATSNASGGTALLDATRAITDPQAMACARKFGRWEAVADRSTVPRASDRASCSGRGGLPAAGRPR